MAGRLSIETDIFPKMSYPHHVLLSPHWKRRSFRFGVLLSTMSSFVRLDRTNEGRKEVRKKDKSGKEVKVPGKSSFISNDALLSAATRRGRRATFHGQANFPGTESGPADKVLQNISTMLSSRGLHNDDDDGGGMAIVHLPRPTLILRIPQERERDRESGAGPVQQLLHYYPGVGWWSWLLNNNRTSAIHRISHSHRP